MGIIYTVRTASGKVGTVTCNCKSSLVDDKLHQVVIKEDNKVTVEKELVVEVLNELVEEYQPDFKSNRFSERQQ